MTETAADLPVLSTPVFSWLAAGALVACRLGGLFGVALVGWTVLFPVRLRLGILAVVAAATLCAEPVRAALLGREEALLRMGGAGADGWLLMASEVFFGAILGWLLLLVLGAVRAACHLIAQQIGISGEAIVDPLSVTEDRILSRFYTVLAVVVLLSADLHHTLIRTVAESFIIVPPGALDASLLSRFLGGVALGVGPDLFVAAAGLALPVVAAMLLVSLFQGLCGRMLPEAELLVLGIPVRAVFGLGVLAATLPRAALFVRALLEGAAADGRRIVEVLSG